MGGGCQHQKPLEGVIVVAHWELHQSTVGGRIPAGQLMVIETVTDKDGRFYFSKWGPKRRSKGYLDDRDPAILLFKGGYEYRGLQNLTKSYINENSVRRSMWHGKTIELQPFKGGLEAYAGRLYRLSSDMDSMLDFARGDKTCNWKKTPQMLATLHKMSLHFDKKGVKLKGWRLGQHILRVQDIPHNPDCGSPKEFLQSYLS